ncbi:WD repeat-containing protein 44-like [Impatiens glandulifera]|uniref:WD repeat-containing protein 44-like n=1 Tax=Impatiens glandulifera TaxID=253017 RepID=UPI001FB15525|nr:WD repeat-containing protein 44-like [Impatiens glandulifera]
MSTAGADEEDEEEERFYDSLDHILSSNSLSSSTSSSSEEEEEEDKYSNSSSDSHNYAPDCPVPIPRFPIAVSNNYDVWISEPSSVQERRLRLLRRFGLSRDPLLSSATDDDFHGDFDRSFSADQLSNSRQKSGNVSCSYSNARDHLSLHHLADGQFVSNRSVLLEARSCNASSLNKPPTGKNSRKVEETRSDSISSNVNIVENGSNGELHVLDFDDVNESVCRIKDLDNGKEFVVDEFRDDGMWNKLKEVSTGRQLTMEEFDMSVGQSPIVQELMRRQNIEDLNKDDMYNHSENGSSETVLRSRKKGGGGGGGDWLKSIRHVAASAVKGRKSSDERDTSSEKGGRRSSSATDDSKDGSFHGPERVRVRQYGKSCKELTGLYKNQEINAHNGSIWTLKFSLDGKYLASAGEDCVIHVWQVVKTEKRGDLLLEDGNLNFLLVAGGSPEPTLMMSPRNEFGNKEMKKKRRGRKLSFSQKSINLDHVLVPETVFGLSDKPICSFTGHLDDVLDLSWSKSQQLLSSSMDKTVRLWDLYSKSCLKIFSHSDYVTCIQFNPVDERYFISGSLDGKVRIWSIPDRQVVDWSDLREMVTAACYTPDGTGAFVGSYKGSCRLYNTSENKLQQECEINLQNKKKKSHKKKITGFQFVPGSSSEVLVTSSDSRIRVIDGVDLVHKFKGFRNSNSQISGSITENGRYVVCASEDSHVYVWKQEEEWSYGAAATSTTTRRRSKGGGVSVAGAYEHFHCEDVSVAIPWPGVSDFRNSLHFDQSEEICAPNHLQKKCNGIISGASSGYFFDRISPATWPEEEEEKLHPAATKRHSPRVSLDDFSDGLGQNKSASWGMVILTAGLKGELRTYQNFGLPIGGI